MGGVLELVHDLGPTGEFECWKLAAIFGSVETLWESRVVMSLDGFSLLWHEVSKLVQRAVASRRVIDVDLVGQVRVQQVDDGASEIRCPMQMKVVGMVQRGVLTLRGEPKKVAQRAGGLFPNDEAGTKDHGLHGCSAQAVTHGQFRGCLGDGVVADGRKRLVFCDGVLFATIDGGRAEMNESPHGACGAGGAQDAIRGEHVCLKRDFRATLALTGACASRVDDVRDGVSVHYVMEKCLIEHGTGFMHHIRW